MPDQQPPARRPLQAVDAATLRPALAAQAKTMPEATLLAQCKRLARGLGWLVYHTHFSARSEPGFPDLVLVHADQRRTLFRELKSQKGYTSTAQDTWLAALREAGQDADVWRPADLLGGRIHDELAPAPGPDSPWSTT